MRGRGGREEGQPCFLPSWREERNRGQKRRARTFGGKLGKKTTEKPVSRAYKQAGTDEGTRAAAHLLQLSKSGLDRALKWRDLCRQAFCANAHPPELQTPAH